MIKRIVSVLMAAAFLCTFCMGMAVSAKTQSEADIIRSGFRSFKSDISLSRSVKKNGKSFNDVCEIIYDDIEKIMDDIYIDKEFFYVSDDGYCEVSGKEYSDRFEVNINFHINYITTRKELPKYRKKFNSAVNEYISGIDSKWADVQKCAYLHDKLVLDTEYLKNGDSRYEGTPYAALADKKALCSGYSRAYAILLNEVGIKSILVQNDGHEWNLVKLGKDWYHVDCTYDDPEVNGTSISYIIRHTYFLKSDKALENHVSYYPSGKAVSAKFDGINWDSLSPFAFYGNEIIFNSGSSICSYNIKNGKTKTIDSVNETWKCNDGTYNYTIDGNHSQICQSGPVIYYNTAHSIKKYDLKTGKISTIYTNKERDGFIVGLTKKGSRLNAWITYDTTADKPTFITNI